MIATKNTLQHRVTKWLLLGTALAGKHLMIKTRSVNTPPGTQPQPTRRSTKSRRAGYSAELVERASARRKSKKERAAKARQRQAAMVVAFGAPATNAPANPPVGAPVRTPVRKPRKSRAA